MMDQGKHPKWWVRAPLSELTSKLIDGSHNPPRKQKTGYPMLSAINISRNKIHFSSYRLISEADFIIEHQRTHVQAGDVLLTIVGAIGRAAIVNQSTQPFTLQRSVAVLKPLEIDSRFLMYQLESPRISAFFKENSRGTAQKGIYLGTLSTTDIWFPSHSEQRRIVAKIEELFSELDKGIENLKTAREQLKVYRQAVLKHAFEGKLTAQWREENKDKLESPKQLLARIQTERETHYRHALEEWRNSIRQWELRAKEGLKPSKPLKPKTLQGFSSDEMSRSGTLPEGWMWTRIGNIALVGTGITPLKSTSSFYVNGDIPWVTSSALNNPFIREPSGYVTIKALNNTNLRLYPVHTLVVALYGEGKTRGKCSELLIEATTNQAIAAILQEGLSAELRRFLKWYLTKNYEAMRFVASGGVQSNLNLGIIENTAIPLCSLSEAKMIAAALDSEFSRIEQLDAEIESQIGKSEVLRQSILKKAFSGQLVPQDPNDEPASALLERIRAEKTSQPKRGKRAHTAEA